MSSLSLGDMLRGIAQQALAAQDAKSAPADSPRGDSTAAVAQDLSKLPPQQQQADVAQSQEPQGPQSPFGQSAPMDFGGQAASSPDMDPNAPTVLQPGQPQPSPDPMQFQQQQFAAQQQSEAKLDAQLDVDRARILNQNAATEATTGALMQKNDAGLQTQLQGKRDEAAVAEQERQAKAPINQEQIDFMQHQTQAKQQLYDWHATQLQQTIANQNQYRDQMLQMANEHPEDIWGNATIGGKIAGIIGIIGAGFAHKDASQMVDQAIQSAVAVQLRKSEFLKKANDQNSAIADMGEKLFESKDAAIDAMTANYNKIFAARLGQVAARYTDPTKQAQLLQLQGEFQQKAATFDSSAVDKAMTHKYQGLQDLVKLDGEMAARKAAASSSLSHGALVPVIGRLGGVSKEAMMKLAPIFAGGHTLIGGIDRIEQLSEQIHEAEAHGDVGNWKKIATSLREDYNTQKDGLLAAWREYTKSGAKIEAGEQKNFDSTIPTFLSALAPESITAEHERLHEARDLIVDSLRNTGDAYGYGSSQFDPNFPLYKTSVARIEARGKRGEAQDKQSKADTIAAQALAKYKQMHPAAAPAQDTSTYDGTD